MSDAEITVALSSTKAAPAKHCRRWLQFSLRTLMIATVLIATGLGLGTSWYRRASRQAKLSWTCGTVMLVAFTKVSMKSTIGVDFNAAINSTKRAIRSSGNKSKLDCSTALAPSSRMRIGITNGFLPWAGGMIGRAVRRNVKKPCSGGTKHGELLPCLSALSTWN